MDIKQKRRDQIADAAVQLMIKYGNNQFSLDDLRKEAKISTGTLYKYFSNKEDVLSHILCRRSIQGKRLVKTANLSKHLTAVEKFLLIQCYPAFIKQFKTETLPLDFLPGNQAFINRLTPHYATQLKDSLKIVIEARLNTLDLFHKQGLLISSSLEYARINKKLMIFTRGGLLHINHPFDDLFEINMVDLIEFNAEILLELNWKESEKKYDTRNVMMAMRSLSDKIN